MFFRAVQIALVSLVLGTQDGRADAQVVDIPTRPGVVQRVSIQSPGAVPTAILLLYPGGAGVLRIADDGSLGAGNSNFLMRARGRFADAGFAAVAMDVPSDRKAGPYLDGFRDTRAHVADAKATIAWMRSRYPGRPVWLVGTSAGTRSVAYIAAHLPVADGGPDGIVLTATVFAENDETPVPRMAIDVIAVPVLMVHHRRDGCWVCPFGAAAWTLARFKTAPRKALLAFDGGAVAGDECEGLSHHGFYGIEADVVAAISVWIAAPDRPSGNVP